MLPLPGAAVPTASRLPRTVAALICIGLAAASVLFFGRQRSDRAKPEAFVRKFAIDLRRPEETGAMRLEGEPDLAAGISVRAVLSETAGSLPSAPGAGTREEELAGARDLTLAAAATRPGWAYHRYLLGRLAQQIGGYEHDPPSAPTSWETSTSLLQLAAAGAPGVDEIWSALGQAYLDNWQKLSSERRSEATPVLRRALQDPHFVTARFLALSVAVGRDEAMSLLPENPELLGAAADSFSVQGDLTAVAALLDRRDAAERKRRAADLAVIEGRFRERDRNGLRTACANWAADHPTSELDDSAGRAQAARILELWPGDRGGPWEGDPRADLVRFFLDGRESAVSAETLSRTLGALSDVPDHVVARVKLLGGDLEGAEELASRPQNQGAPEWTIYYAELARLLLKQGHPRDARGALDRLALTSRDGCEALLARQQVARALNDTAELALVGQRLAALRISAARQEPVTGGVTLSVCVDPEQAGGRSLDLKLASQGPAVIRYGWGIGRAGTMFLRDEAVVSVPLAGLSGARSLTVQSVAGAPVRASVATAGTR